MTSNAEIPLIENYMTPMPLTMDLEARVKQADEFMTRNSIRHLPVVDKMEQLAGVVTDREVKVGLLFPGPGELLLKDLIATSPFIVSPDTALDEVVFEMMEHKYSCAIIQDDQDKLIGIFTEIDALRAFHELLGELYRSKAA